MKQSPAEELQDFHRFVGQKLEQGNGSMSPEDVLDEWLNLHPGRNGIENPVDAVTAVRLALADMKAGDKGTPADEVLAELRGLTPAK